MKKVYGLRFAGYCLQILLYNPKPIFFILFSLFFFQPSSSQPFGNEWINYNQKYLEIKITSEGIYRIDSATLFSALNNIGIISADPRKIQIFGSGEEQYIHVEGENDSTFNANDFIEFYAAKNDGWFDSLLYVTSAEQSNPHYSLFNDTATYFLTVSQTEFGKRMTLVNSSNFAQFSPVSFFFKEEIFIPSSLAFYTAESQNPLYAEGKGWFDATAVNSDGPTSISYSLNTPAAAQSAPDATGIIVYTGANGNAHNIKISYGSTSITDNFIAYSLRKKTFGIPASSMGNTTTFTYQTLTPPSPDPDRTALSHIYLKYPRITSSISPNSKFMMLFSPGNTNYISFSATTTFPFAYDLTTHSRISTTQSNGTKIVIPAANSERKIYLTPSNQIQNITVLIPAANAGSFTDFEVMQKDSAFIIISHKKLMSAANSYANYKDNPNHQAFVADIDELYEQFSYGINKHPLAIRNFCNFLLNKWNSPPQHLFIIGKGISEANFSTRNNPSLYEQNLIPTFGWPSSDVAFTSGLNGTLTEPAIPTGRLAAKTTDEVEAYLEKVDFFEKNLVEITKPEIQNIANKLWMKHAIHFCGGNTSFENDQFCGYLQQYENTLKSDLYGGYVTTIAKNSPAPIQVNLTDSIRNLIEKSGVSIMTFFGHSTSSTSDISIGYAAEYNNYEKYPLIIANGCFSGDIFTPGSQSTSEDFVLEPNKGAIAYIAHTGLGFPGALHAYTGALYNHISKQSYNKSIGKCAQQGIIDTQGSGSNFTANNTSLGMTLHGDPSLPINTHVLPDYDIEAPYVFFTPQDVTDAVDSFTMNVVIANLGMAVTDSLSISVTRIFPDGTTVDYLKRIKPVFYLDTFRLRMPVDNANGIGLNQFCIHVDPNNAIPEITTLNNYLCGNSVELLIKSNDLIPIYPYNYAVVPNRSIVLKASTSDPFSSPRDYIFQIDTTDAYNSPKFQQLITNSSGGVVKWSIDTNYFNLPDSVAFFWRTSPNTPSDFRWREHSFQVISDKTGWGQKHFFQYKNNDYIGIKYKKLQREFEFEQTFKGLKCYVYGNPQTNAQYDATEYKLDNAQQDYNICNGYNTPAMLVAIIDECTLKPLETKKQVNFQILNPDNDFGNGNNMNENHPNNCRPKPEKYFSFMLYDNEQMDSLAQLLDHKIPNGYYVLVYTAARGMFQNSGIWKPYHFQAFQKHGATKITTVGDSIPYIFFTKIGDTAWTREVAGTWWNDFIQFDTSLAGCIGKGTITTSAIGPAYKWGSLHWEFTANNFSNDSVKIEVLDEFTDVPVTSFSTFSGDVFPLDSVDAAMHPYIKLRANIKDSLLFTAAQLRRWHVLYDEIPEAALNPKLGYNFHASALQQGDNLKFNIAIENVSISNMDSLRIKYRIDDIARNTNYTVYKKNRPLPAGDVMFDTISFPTNNISGNCNFWVEVNPRDSLWQLEQYHFNNIARLGFKVEKDNINPLLDVTFDGVRILNGDIVSPKPEIVIQLKDENKFLAMDDTSKFKIFISDPDKKTERIYFSENGKEQMNFKKATLPENKCRIEYAPVFEKDGIYELRVQGSDASENVAGDMDYSITFEVINKSTITEVLNYPNPFSTSTRFVFTLTGMEIPDYFKIQILTVSGKVVREITRDELGTIHIGRNITDYAWNSTDEFGDPLANGVYLYRVIVKINGENIEHRETNADTFFKKGFGKMYLMR